LKVVLIVSALVAMVVASPKENPKGVPGGWGGPQTPSLTSCLACQTLVNDVTSAVQQAKVSYYGQLTADLCNTLFPPADQLTLVNAFCNTIVAGGGLALNKLVHDNAWNVQDTCITLGACEAKECPDGQGALAGQFKRLSKTHLCAACTATAVDRFTAEFLKYNNIDQEFPNVRICSVEEYRQLADGWPLQSDSSYYTSDIGSYTDGNCTESVSGCGNSQNDVDIRETPNGDLFLYNLIYDTVTVAVSASSIRSIVKSNTNTANVCLCAGYGDNVPFL